MTTAEDGRGQPRSPATTIPLTTENEESVSGHSSEWARQALAEPLLKAVGSMMAAESDPFVVASGQYLLQVDDTHKPDPRDVSACDSGCPVCYGCDYSWQRCWPCSEWLNALRVAVVWLMAREPSGDLVSAREKARLRKQRQRDRDRDVSRDSSMTEVSNGAGGRYVTAPDTVTRTNREANREADASAGQLQLQAASHG